MPKPTDDPKPSPWLLKAAVYANSFKSIAHSEQSTGFRTQGLRHRALSFSELPRVAEEFLVASRLIRGDRESEASIEAYFSDSSAALLSKSGEETAAFGTARALPSSGVDLRMDLGEAIARRRSVRSYTGDAIDLEGVATILRAAAGVTGEAVASLSDGSEVALHFRACPSGGGLYPVDVHVAATRTRGLDRGIYRYQPLGDALLQVGGEADLDALLGAFSVPEEQISVRRSGAIFFLVGQPWKSMRKYGARGLRFVFMEAGSIAEHIHLAAASLGLGSVDCASIYDDEAHEALGLDGVFRTLLHVVVLGHPG